MSHQTVKPLCVRLPEDLIYAAKADALGNRQTFQAWFKEATEAKLRLRRDEEQATASV